MCVSPVVIKRQLPDGSFRYVKVPCGKCNECLASYQNQWAIRLEQESSSWKYLFFLTLTYREDTVPYSKPDDDYCIYRELRKSDLQDALKRFRESLVKKFGKRIKFKYFGCGEYGSKTHRPHYHLLIFIDKPLYSVVMLANDWRKRFGHVDLKQVNTISKLGVAKYVSKYAAKGIFEEKLVNENKVTKPFRVMSKGIGKDFAIQLRDKIHRQVRTLFPLGIRGDYYGYNRDYFEYLYSMKRLYVNGALYSMPKYWYEFLFFKKVDYICEVSDVKHRYFDDNLKMWLCPVKTKISKRYDKNSHFALAFAAFLLEKRDELYTEKFRQLQAQNPTWSDTQVHLACISEEQKEREDRNLNIGQKLVSFYLKSNI